MGKQFRKSLARKKPTRTQKRNIVLVSEGQNTERDYFKALEAKIDTSKTQLSYYGPCGDPSAVHRRAADELAKLARENGGKKRTSDEVWAVFDEDDHHHFRTAITSCRQSGIQAAFSIPCFEVWLIWHLEEFGRLDDHTQVQNHFKTLCSGYHPKGSKTTDFKPIIENWQDAETRAKAAHAARDAEGDGLGRPSSTLYQLTESLFPLTKEELAKGVRLPVAISKPTR